MIDYMIVHIALFKWKDGVGDDEIKRALDDVRALKEKVPGLIDIRCGENFSKWNEGYTHAVVVLGKDQASLDAYRQHPDHEIVAQKIEAMEERGIGVDFED
jgi:hypothetical protein